MIYAQQHHKQCNVYLAPTASSKQTPNVRATSLVQAQQNIITAYIQNCSVVLDVYKTVLYSWAGHPGKTRTRGLTKSMQLYYSDCQNISHACDPCIWSQLGALRIGSS